MLATNRTFKFIYAALIVVAVVAMGLTIWMGDASLAAAASLITVGIFALTGYTVVAVAYARRMQQLDRELEEDLSRIYADAMRKAYQ